MVEKVPRGYRQTEVGVIPEDWEVDSLGNMTDLMTNGFVGPVKQHYVDYCEGVIYIQGYNVKENSFNFNGIKQVTNEFHKRHSKSWLQEDDLLTVQTGDVGLTTIVPKEMAGANCHALIITRLKNKYKAKYFSCYLNSSIGRMRLKEIETGTTMKHINVGEMIQYFVPIPPLPEQTAIAEALSDVDRLISSLKKLIAKKQSIKQGAMQELLTGKKRLSGFSGKLQRPGGYEKTEMESTPADWEVKTLSEICNLSKRKYNPINCSENYQCIELEHISQNTGRLLGYIDSLHQLSHKTYFSKGNVLLGKLRPYLRKYLFADFAGVCSTEFWVLKSHGNIESKFLYYVIQTDKVIEECNQSIGTKMPRAEWNNVKKVMILLPPLTEQTAIAQVLSDMDEEIAKLTAKLNKYKAIKQGMMQELLTGKRRLV